MNREEIIDHTNNLFREHGIKAITMDTLSKSLSISKRTLYQMFKDKDALLYECILHTSVSYKKRALEVINNSDNIIDGMRNFGKLHYSIMKSVNPNFFTEMKKYHPNVFKKIEQNGEIRDSEISFTILKRARNLGYFRKDINIDVANNFMHASSKFIMEQMQEDKYDDNEIVNSSIIAYLKGLCTPKGLEAFAQSEMKSAQV